LPKWPVVRLQLAAFCTSAERLAWAKANGCPWGDDFNFEWYAPNCCAHAAGGGHLEALQWARKQDPPCPWGVTTCSFAAGGGHLDVLRWLRGHGCPWDMVETCYAAAGHLEVLQWAWEQDPSCVWGKLRACEFAAEGGHLEVLKWAREHDCGWDSATCSRAARGGHLQVLKWAREQGCPLDVHNLRREALAGGNEEILRWMREEGMFDQGYDQTVDEYYAQYW